MGPQDQPSYVNAVGPCAGSTGMGWMRFGAFDFVVFGCWRWEVCVWGGSGCLGLIRCLWVGYYGGLCLVHGLQRFDGGGGWLYAWALGVGLRRMVRVV